jgi:hypothetical protein
LSEVIIMEVYCLMENDVEELCYLAMNLLEAKTEPHMNAITYICMAVITLAEWVRLAEVREANKLAARCWKSAMPLPQPFKFL